MSRITVISVAYNSMAVLPGMVESLPPDTPLVVVNNGPDDGVDAWALSHGLNLITPDHNLGFGTACNLGAGAAETEFLLFLNPDARLLPDTLNELLSVADRFPAASAFAPLLQEADGTIHFKRRSFLNRADAAPRDPGNDPRQVSSLSGAAMLVRRSAFVTVGGFDPKIFLYYEDDDLAYRLARDVGPLILVPSLRVSHFSGESSTPSPALSRFKGFHWARSRIYVGRKYGLRNPWWQGLRNAIWRLIGPKSWRSAERRNEALGRLSGAWSARRS